MPVQLLIDALVAGVLLGGFYAAVSIGLSVAFGLLDVPHIAHPAFLVLGAYGVYLLGQYGVDPLLAGALLTPVFFAVGAGRVPLLSRRVRAARQRQRACAGWPSSSASRSSSKWR